MENKNVIAFVFAIGFIIVVFIGAGTYFVLTNHTPQPSVYSGECKTDSDCPHNYRCEALESTSTACSTDDPNCQPITTIIKGMCRLSLQTGSTCNFDQECETGVCRASVCVIPIGRQCSGPNDGSCPTGFRCVQGCGWPVPRPDEPPPSYFCQVEGYDRPCPICLAAHTLIDTPQGFVPVKDLEVGMPIWTTDTFGNRVSGVVQKNSRVPVAPTHEMVHLVFNDGRDLFVSPGHPTIDGRTVSDLLVGDEYDGARVISLNRVPYSEGATYDILPSGATGFYWANGVLLDSTLHFRQE